VAVLLAVILVAAANAIWLCVEMSRRDQPLLGLAALGILVADGVLGAVYGALTAA
jgi:hypothetical protein